MQEYGEEREGRKKVKQKKWKERETDRKKERERERERERGWESFVRRRCDVEGRRKSKWTIQRLKAKKKERGVETEERGRGRGREREREREREGKKRKTSYKSCSMPLKRFINSSKRVSERLLLIVSWR